VHDSDEVTEPAAAPVVGSGGDEAVDPAGLPPLRRWARIWQGKDPYARAAVVVDALVVTAAAVFVLVQLAPSLLALDTTPAGGDMGAHVWGPAYLRDELLPNWRLSGWAPDWYAGFPAYHFYMVVPALAIVALDAGWEGWAALVPLAAALGLLMVSGLHPDRRVRRVAFVAGVTVAVVGAGLPYGVAFKWVTVAGLIALPAACYVTARLADLPFPGPPLAALAAVVFLFNREPLEASTGNIIGGNVASTLAGEFSFSLSLLSFVLFVGFLLRGLRTGGHRATAAVLLALTAVSHVIPAIYAIGAVVVALVVTLPLDRARLRWFAPIGPVALALSAFWTLPFVLRRGYLNDMGWEKLPNDCPAGAEACQSYGDFLWPGALRWVVALAVVGAVISVVLRIRFGVFLALCAAGSAVAFVLAPQGRFWNARILPLYLLSLSLLVGIAVAELGRAVASVLSRRPERIVGPAAVATPVGAALAAWVVVGLPLGVLPFGERTADGGERWLGLEVDAGDRNVVRDWARWNYSGYERKAAYPEYHGLVEMGQRIAADPDLGCGRVMWEYENDRLNTYGTPMAPMLLPFWTNGCIGSMEGLYFEASATTPYHFLNQRALSDKCSCAQRDLPYGTGLDLDLGIRQLQQMGVRYYFAFSPAAVAAADAHPDLTPVDRSDPWRAYLVAGSELVVPLANRPAVLRDVEPGMAWVGPASKWWQDPERWDVLLAEDGPDRWERLDVCEASPAEGGEDRPTWTRLDACTTPTEVPLPEVEVSNVEVENERLSFDVSEPGVPVLVKVSYFPNWQASGAEGPYRVTPNHMVVVPTSTRVELTYGRTSVDLGAYALSGIGVLGVVGLARFPRRRDREDTDLWLDGPALGPEPTDDGDELDEAEAALDGEGGPEP